MPETGYALWHGGTCKTDLDVVPFWLSITQDASCHRAENRSLSSRSEEWVVPSDEQGSNNLCGRMFAPDEHGTIRGEHKHAACGFVVGPRILHA